MNKSTFFTGQPIFSQLLKFIPRDTIARIAKETKADHYCKRFNTYEHLITILYSVFNNCNSLREVTTGMLASEQRLGHLGVRYHPRRSTISDANSRRQSGVFEQIYFSIYKKYSRLLSDSRPTQASKFYIIDSTTIKLFHDVLRAGGGVPTSGKCKGGIKVHTLIRSDQDVPNMVRLTSGVANDSQFLKEVSLPKGSIIVFDRGYRDFEKLNKFSEQGITWVTRRSSLYAIEYQEKMSNFERDKSILSDNKIIIGYRRKRNRVKARLVRYRDPESGETYEFLTNNFKMNGLTITGLYRKRWQIELLFKRFKQNYPLKYFLGDSENAIKIQIWCALIADLILKIVKKATTARWSFSNLAAMIRLHLMTYINLFSFLKSPEKALRTRFPAKKLNENQQLKFIT